VIHVDSRFTRTSALADLHVPIRAGSDIAFLGGIVNYVLEHDRYFREYVVAYTNAPVIVDEGFRDTEDLDGLFSGYNPETCSYDTSTWQYQDMEVAASAGQRELQATAGGGERHGSHGGLSGGRPPHTDPTLQHPRCVFQLLRKHYRRYTPELVEQVCGVPKDLFLEVAEALCANSGRERTSTFCYAVGWTQHTVGVQYIRTAAILQLLLGNIGRPGGGIMALRGHASIQGSTDIPTLYNLLPGYIPMPHAKLHQSLEEYVELNSSPTGYWGGMRGYLVSLLKAWWGAAATAGNDFCFDYLPRINQDHSTYQTTLAMLEGRVEGFFVLGENPAVGSANSGLHRKALAKLDWLVVRDFVETETAAFWYDAPEIETGELRTEEIPTEVFLLPAAAHTEKDGSFTNTQRLLQWHHQAVEPPGDSRSELWFMYHLGRIIREKLAGSTAERDRPVLDLTWDYPTTGTIGEPSADAVLREIGGWDAEGRRCPATCSWPTTGPPSAAAGSTAAATPRRSTSRRGACPGPSRLGWRRSGAGPGPTTAGCSTTEPRPTQTASRGRSASATSGGTPSRASGPAMTPRTSKRTSRPTTSHPRTPPVGRLFGATSRSSCRPTGWAGCTSPAACATGPSPPTTSRMSRPSPIRCTASRPTRPASASNGPATVPTRATATPGPPSTRTC